MTIFLISIHIISSIVIILLVLLQSGKGSSIGASLGGGGSQTLFGPTGSGNILTKITTVIAIIFMVTSISLAYLSGKSHTGSVMKQIEKQVPVKTQPVSDKNNISKTPLDKKAQSKGEK
ncbi:MAG: preprotein translocase subunit SecG [Deltaproteobacteria bacterium]|nr:MAG: preprotein translocase subunit SecG [Deltaproteobacteria bacterium]PIE74948.1 MAG: preprotein translocase subunit SecG [Deltaproteobacteria bacterium]